MSDSKWYLVSEAGLWKWLWKEVFVCETSMFYTKLVQLGFRVAKYSSCSIYESGVSVSILSLLIRRCGEHCQYCWYWVCSLFLISSTRSADNNGYSCWGVKGVLLQPATNNTQNSCEHVEKICAQKLPTHVSQSVLFSQAKWFHPLSQEKIPLCLAELPLVMRNTKHEESVSWINVKKHEKPLMHASIFSSHKCVLWSSHKLSIVLFADVSAISFPNMPTCSGIQMGIVLDGTAKIGFNMSCANGCRLVWFLELSKKRADKESVSMQFFYFLEFGIALTLLSRLESHLISESVNLELFLWHFDLKCSKLDCAHWNIRYLYRAAGLLCYYAIWLLTRHRQLVRDQTSLARITGERGGMLSSVLHTPPLFKILVDPRASLTLLSELFSLSLWP